MGHQLTYDGVPVQVVEHVAQAEDGGGCPSPAAPAGGLGLLRAGALGSSGCAARGAGGAGRSRRGPPHAARQRLHLVVGARRSSGAHGPRPAAAAAAASSELRPPAPAPPLRVRLLVLRAARRRRGAVQAHHAGRERGGGGRGGRAARLGPAQGVCAPRSRRSTIPAPALREPWLRRGPGSARCAVAAAAALTAAARLRPPRRNQSAPGPGHSPAPHVLPRGWGG